MSNIVDVALKARVYIATVSRVVNKSLHKVNRETRDRVLAAISELDYRPNALAKGLLMKKTMTIGIIIFDISNPYYAEDRPGHPGRGRPGGYAVTLHNTVRRQEGTYAASTSSGRKTCGTPSSVGRASFPISRSGQQPPWRSTKGSSRSLGTGTWPRPIG